MSTTKKTNKKKHTPVFFFNKSTELLHTEMQDGNKDVE